jgi:hypothetical protein
MAHSSFGRTSIELDSERRDPAGLNGCAQPEVPVYDLAIAANQASDLKSELTDRPHMRSGSIVFTRISRVLSQPLYRPVRDAQCGMAGQHAGIDHRDLK